MKKILTLFLSLYSVFAFAQSSTYSSYSELDVPSTPIINTHRVINPILPAPSGITYYNNRTTFYSNRGNLPMETWASSKVPNNYLESSSAPFNSLTNNLCFASGDILPGIEINTDNIPDHNLVLITTGTFGVPFNVLGPSFFNDDLQLLFDNPVQDIGFDIIQTSFFTSDGFEIYIYDENGDYLTYTTSPDGGSGSIVFWGISSDTPIGKVVFRSLSGAGGELIGNVAFGNAGPSVPINKWVIYSLFLLIAVTTILRYKSVLFKKAS